MPEDSSRGMNLKKLVFPILERVKKPLEKALVEAGLCTEEIHTVEVVGSGSMVPAIRKILTTFFRKELCRTMDTSESVAIGCAVECAILSPAFTVRDCPFQVNDFFPFSISMSWKGLVAKGQNEATEILQSITLMPKGTPIPALKVVTFARSGTLAVNLHYADASVLQAPDTIGPFKSAIGDLAKLKARLLEMGKKNSVPVVKEAPKMDTDVSNRPETMQNAKGKAHTAENDVPESAETSAHETEAKPVQMDKDYKENSNVANHLETVEMLMEEKRTMEAILSELKFKNEKMEVLLLEKDDLVKELEASKSAIGEKYCLIALAVSWLFFAAVMYSISSNVSDMAIK